MTPELLDLLNKYGLPGWALILIGGGTIVAAIISSINALGVAVINAWAAKRVAVYAAHREYRATMSATVLEHIRSIAGFAIDVQRARIRSHDELVAHTTAWGNRLHQLAPMGAIFFPDRTVYDAWSFARRRYIELGEVLRMGTNGDLASAMVKTMKLRAAAGRLLIGCETVEFAVEGYVFELRFSTRRARWHMRRFRIRQTLRPYAATWRATIAKIFRH